MRHLLTALALVLITLPCYSGLKKAEPKDQKEIIVDSKNVYKENGSLDIPAIFELKKDDKIFFNINDKKHYAVVVKVDLTKERIIVAGKLLDTEEAGFIFVGTFANQSVGGTVYFMKDQVNYVLRHNEKKDLFYLEEKKNSIKSGEGVFAN
jgi:hypothetical protein